MKLSIVVSTQPASFTALAYKGRLRETLGKIKALGYDGVELAVRDPGLLDIEQVSAWLTDSTLPAPAIGTGQAYGVEGFSLTHSDPELRRRGMERIKSQIRLAARWNAAVIIGLIRGKSEPGIPIERKEDLLLEALRECAAENRGVKLAIEPINRYETDLLNSVKATITPNDITRKAIKILGTYIGQNTCLPAIRILQAGKIDMSHFFSEVIPLEEGIGAFPRLGLNLATLEHGPKQAMKIVLHP